MKGYHSMKKLLSFAAVVAMFATLSFGTANAGERDFTLHNRTGYNIAHINVSHVDESNWRNLLNSYVPAYSGKHFNVWNDGGLCQTQIQIVWMNGATADFTLGFDLCTDSDVWVYIDGTGHVYGNSN